MSPRSSSSILFLRRPLSYATAFNFSPLFSMSTRWWFSWWWELLQLFSWNTLLSIYTKRDISHDHLLGRLSSWILLGTLSITLDRWSYSRAYICDVIVLKFVCGYRCYSLSNGWAVLLQFAWMLHSAGYWQRIEFVLPSVVCNTRLN
jgi:hypothetical protein